MKRRQLIISGSRRRHPARRPHTKRTLAAGIPVKPIPEHTVSYTDASASVHPLFGINIVVCDAMPANEAWLVSADLRERVIIRM